MDSRGNTILSVKETIAEPHAFQLNNVTDSKELFSRTIVSYVLQMRNLLMVNADPNAKMGKSMKMENVYAKPILMNKMVFAIKGAHRTQSLIITNADAFEDILLIPENVLDDLIATQRLNITVEKNAYAEKVIGEIGISSVFQIFNVNLVNNLITIASNVYASQDLLLSIMNA